MKPEIYLLASASAAFVLGWLIGRWMLGCKHDDAMDRLKADHSRQIHAISIHSKHEGVQAQREAEAVERKRSKLHTT